MRRASFRVSPEELEPVLDRLLPGLPGGVHVTPGAHAVEVAVVAPDPPGEAAVRALLGREPAGWAEQAVPADSRLRRLGAGVRVGRIVVRPPDAPPPPGGAVDVVVEPHSVVFGSGSHPTTRMCLELLDRVAAGAGGDGPGGLADLGCGLGTLAIAAAKLGFAPVTAVDVEPAAVAATRAHAERNGVEVAATEADLTAGEPPWQPTLVLNAAPRVHAHVAQRLPDSVRTVVVSSFVEAEEAQVLDPWRAAGLTVAERLTEESWVALRLSREAGPEPPRVPPDPQASGLAAEPAPPGGEPVVALAEVLDPDRPVQAGAALGQLAARLPDGGLVISSARTVEIGARAALVYVPGLFRFDVTPRHETLGVSLRSLVPVPSSWEADADTFDGFRRVGGAPLSFRGRFELPDGPLEIRLQAVPVPDDDQGAAHVITKAALRPA